DLPDNLDKLSRTTPLCLISNSCIRFGLRRQRRQCHACEARSPYTQQRFQPSQNWRHPAGRRAIIRPLQSRENVNMNRRSFLLRCAIAPNAAILVMPTGASAVRLPTSTLTVSVLSVDRESFERKEFNPPGQPTLVFETIKFVAKAQII